MIEPLYYTESYTEPINSIIKKVNEVICAQNKLELGTSAQQPLNAIALLEDIRAYFAGERWEEDREIAFVKKIDAVLAQQQ